jgi:dTDP-4-dehydrorhamnose 3,5-epimerase
LLKQYYEGASVKVSELGAQGLTLFEGPIFPDSRGHFMELHKQSQFSSYIPETVFVQDNLSFSKKGVIRGMHLQISPGLQGKFVRCLEGRIHDFVVDVRKDSPTFKKLFGVELDGSKNQSLYVPPGFLHGFQALEDALVVYKCTYEFTPKLERGVRFDSPELKIPWPLSQPQIVSDKDRALPAFSEFNFDEV